MCRRAKPSSHCFKRPYAAIVVAALVGLVEGGQCALACVFGIVVVQAQPHAERAQHRPKAAVEPQPRCLIMRIAQTLQEGGRGF